MSKTSGNKNPQKCFDELTEMWSFLHGVYTYQDMKRHMIYVFFYKETLMNLMSTLVSLPLLKT